jgi:5'-nucleotidase
VVQAHFAGQWLGRLDITFDDAGDVVAWEGEPVVLDASQARDPEVQAMIEDLAGPLVALKRLIIAETTADLIGDQEVCRFNECNLGNLVTDAMLWQTRAMGTEVAVINAGAIRSGIGQGPITRGQLLEVFPFANTLSTFRATGRSIRTALEGALSRADNPRNTGTGRFPQVAGLRLSWSPDRPVGSRLGTVEVRDIFGSWSPLEEQMEYTVATTNFLRAGGDEYTVFRDQARQAYDGGVNLDEALAAYLALQGTVSPQVEGRIRRGP